MTSKPDIQQLVRARARFKCENCLDFAVAQYAHIIPESDDGDYDLNNLLFLCYPCHRNFEPALAASQLKQTRVRHLQEIKHREKIDSIAEGLFELPVGKSVEVNLGGGLKVANTPKIFTEDPNSFPVPSNLTICEKNGLVSIDGMLKDENFNPIIEFSGTRFKLHTQDFWDIVRKPGKLEIINRSRNLKLRIHQLDDLSLSITGVLFIGNRKILLKKDALVFLPENNRFVNCLVSGSGGAFLFS